MLCMLIYIYRHSLNLEYSLLSLWHFLFVKCSTFEGLLLLIPTFSCECEKQISLLINCSPRTNINQQHTNEYDIQNLFSLHLRVDCGLFWGFCAFAIISTFTFDKKKKKKKGDVEEAKSKSKKFQFLQITIKMHWYLYK